jgi:hypothetical protein
MTVSGQTGDLVRFREGRTSAWCLLQRTGPANQNGERRKPGISETIAGCLELLAKGLDD